jgi:hypothetical protein
MALALAHAGSRVLYCQNPVSWFRHTGRPLAEVEKGIFGFGPEFLGHRLNIFPFLAPIQAKLLANQILKNATYLGLRDPLFIYPHGEYCLSLCQEFKQRGFPLIHICMDYHERQQLEHVRLSDLTLAIPRAAFEELEKQFGGKVRLLPQFSSVYGSVPVSYGDLPEPLELSKIPRPRLGYLGSIIGRLSLPILHELLSNHPEWHFVSFGTEKILSFPNEHILSWRPHQELATFVAGMDIGFMPYDCSDAKNLHCVPLKLFDYFAQGKPVVSTPILYLRGYEEVASYGSTIDELAAAISSALKEPLDSPKKAKRLAIAQEHSIDTLSDCLETILTEVDLASGRGADGNTQAR